MLAVNQTLERTSIHMYDVSVIKWAHNNSTHLIVPHTHVLMKFRTYWQKKTHQILTTIKMLYYLKTKYYSILFNENVGSFVPMCNERILSLALQRARFILFLIARKENWMRKRLSTIYRKIYKVPLRWSNRENQKIIIWLIIICNHNTSYKTHNLGRLFSPSMKLYFLSFLFIVSTT